MIGQVFTTNSVVLWSEQLISEGYKGEEGGPDPKNTSFYSFTWRLRNSKILKIYLKPLKLPGPCLKTTIINCQRRPLSMWLRQMEGFFNQFYYFFSFKFLVLNTLRN